MITSDAFNALLKTLEEPPEHVVFILATTNEEKLPRTIISRCVRIPFGRAEKKDILHMLARIAKEEKIKLPDEVAELIAQSSDYAFRDAAKLFEELVVQNKLTIDEAKQYIGIHGRKSLLEVMGKEDMQTCMQWIEDFTANGGNVRYEMESMLQSLKNQLLLKSNISTDEKDLGFTQKDIVFLMKELHDALEMLRIAPIPAIPLEIVVAEFYNNANR